MHQRHVLALMLAVAGSLAACTTNASRGPDGPDPDSPFAVRVEMIESAVGRWRDAPDLDTARAAAEEAANLVVGPDGPDFGDRDGNGTVEGDVDVGLLTGATDAASGLATEVRGVGCVDSDVLGATAGDVDEGWMAMSTAIANWTPSNNTMPSLASHPQRIVGWATFTQSASDLDLVEEYAGFAQLHVDVTRAAPTC